METLIEDSGINPPGSSLLKLNKIKSIKTKEIQYVCSTTNRYFYNQFVKKFTYKTYRYNSSKQHLLLHSPSCIKDTPEY